MVFAARVRGVEGCSTVRRGRRLREVRAVAAALAVAAAAGGCRSMESWQEAEYGNIRAAGLPEFHPKSPAAAGVLNLLPGIGDAYNGEWGAFACNFLLWPVSVVWGIPEAAVTASNINRQDTWAYYYHGPGKPQLEAALARAGTSPVVVPPRVGP